MERYGIVYQGRLWAIKGTRKWAQSLAFDLAKKNDWKIADIEIKAMVYAN